MARGWHYAKLPLSSALRLSFSDIIVYVPFSLSFLFVCVFLLLSLELCRCSSDLFLSSRPRTGLATTYIINLKVDEGKGGYVPQKEGCVAFLLL